MKKMYMGLMAIAIIGLLFVSGCRQPITPTTPIPEPQSPEEDKLRVINGATCSLTSDCESKYSMVFSNCGCHWSLFETSKLSERADCEQVCPQPREDKPISVRCITMVEGWNNVCNLVWN